MCGCVEDKNPLSVPFHRRPFFWVKFGLNTVREETVGHEGSCHMVLLSRWVERRKRRKVSLETNFS